MGKRSSRSASRARFRTRPTGGGNYVYVACDYQNVARVLQLNLRQEVTPVRWASDDAAPIASAPVLFSSLLYFASIDGARVLPCPRKKKPGLVASGRDASSVTVR